MANKAEHLPFDMMNEWAREKASVSLSSSCELADLLKERLSGLPSLQQEYIEDKLYSSIMSSALLVALTYGSLESVSKWSVS